jgi:hypothetical protein
MKTRPYRPLAQHRIRAAAVPQFVALLGVLHEAAVRGLALLPDPPAAQAFPRLGKNRPRLFQALENTAAT